MKILRLVLLAVSLGLLLYGILAEKHEVNSLVGGEPRTVSGPGLTEIATRDGLLLKEGRVYDIATASSVEEEVPGLDDGQPPECAT